MKKLCLLLTKTVESNTDDFIPLVNLEQKSFEETIKKLEKFWKAKSIALLDKFGLHTLPAGVILQWNKKIEKKVSDFCKIHGWDSVVIRTDKENETGKDIPRGGYLVEVPKLGSEIEKHLQNGRIVMILEPRDRYKNLYGVNILYDSKEQKKLYLEIVGPGFEVSNLNRGDISPHERLIVKLEEKLTILDRNIVSKSSYQESVNLRYEQIGRSVLEDLSQNQSRVELRKIGKNFLKTHGYQLLQRNEEFYQKIPDKYLEKMIKNVIKLLPQVSKIESTVDQFVLSVTVFDSDEIVFWDMVFPKHKYEGMKND